MLLGGALKGGVIHGAFPTDLTKHGPLILSRGRIIPSTPWEALWHGVCEWMGVHASLMTEVLPNHDHFPPEQLVTKEQLFRHGAA